MSPRGALLLLPALPALAACGDPAARVTLVNTSGGCGQLAAPTEVRVIAYGRNGEVIRGVDPGGGPADIGDFPGDTEQIGVEVVIGGGVVAAVGKSAPLDFFALPDGATIPVFVAPLDDFCPAADLTAPRAQPLVARIPTGVLVVGGTGPGGEPLGTAERYDLVTNRFVSVAVPRALGQAGFVGAQLTPMPDGRVVVTGGPQSVLAVYDPATDSFGETKLVVEGRAFHGAVALDETHVLTTAGCAAAGGACGAPRADSHAYDVDEPGSDNAPGPLLAAGRTGATVFDLGLQRDGRRALVAAGGQPVAGAADATAADRFAPDEPAGVAVPGTFAQPALLDGGGVLTAFAPDGAAAPSGAASVIAPEAAAARAIAATLPLGGARVVTLEDGRVLALGGDQPDVLRYDPTADAWQVLPYPLTPARPGPLGAPRLVRLADGAVLVLGGTSGGAPTEKTWIYRPSLIGPATGSITVIPAGPSRANVLTPEDPAAVSRASGWVLAAGPGQLARALVGGPRMAAGSVRAVVRVRAGGVALVAQHEAPGQALVGELVPGAPARIVRLAGAEARAVCSGAAVAAFDPAAPAIVSLAVEGDRAALVRDGATAVSCEVGPASPRGAWGVAALGAAAGAAAAAEVAIDTVTVARGAAPAAP
ncbi:MAG TPA: hypothetical protein VNO30_16035 [Kofleriaceae bacterium]|nr:hypothetical protein [Kofleriaceae bacterium]